MSYYQYGSLKVLHALASEFVLCDNWFCDMPGDTLLNRFFMHTAQTDGHLSDKYTRIDVPTIYDQINVQGVSWKMYAPLAENLGQGIITPIQRPLSTNEFDTRFLSDTFRKVPLPTGRSPNSLPTLARGNAAILQLPDVLVAEERQHLHRHGSIPKTYGPGELHLAAVYNALRNSNYWNNTLLIVTFDENGGLYDHVPSDHQGAERQGGPRMGQVPSCALHVRLTLLGPRVPALDLTVAAHGSQQRNFKTRPSSGTSRDMMGVPGLTQRMKCAGSRQHFHRIRPAKPRPYCPFRSRDIPASLCRRRSQQDLRRPVRRRDRATALHGGIGQDLRA
jgi:phospholipase C